jgi:hypothetical protein
MKTTKQYIQEAKENLFEEEEIKNELIELFGEDYLEEQYSTYLEEKALPGQMTLVGGLASYAFGLGPVGLGLYALYKTIRKKYEKAKRDCSTNLCLKQTRIKESEEKIEVLKKLEADGSDKEKKAAKKAIQKLEAFIDQVKNTKA